MLVGTALAVAGVFLDLKRVGGVHVGVIGLGVNVAIAVIMSLWGARRPPRQSGASGDRST
jgi:hypothetical protein